MLKDFYCMVRGAAAGDDLPPHWDTIDEKAREGLEAAARALVQSSSAPFISQLQQTAQGFNERQNFLAELFAALGLDANGSHTVNDVLAAARDYIAPTGEPVPPTPPAPLN